MDEWLRRACSAIIVSDSSPPQRSLSRTSWPSCRRKRDQRMAVMRLPLRSLGPAGVIRLMFMLPLIISQTVFVYLLLLAHLSGHTRTVSVNISCAFEDDRDGRLLTSCRTRASKPSNSPG